MRLICCLIRGAESAWRRRGDSRSTLRPFSTKNTRFISFLRSHHNADNKAFPWRTIIHPRPDRYRLDPRWVIFGGLLRPGAVPVKKSIPFCNLDVAFMASALARIFFTTLLRGGWYRRGVVTWRAKNPSEISFFRGKKSQLDSGVFFRVHALNVTQKNPNRISFFFSSSCHNVT
jgi:hypothetical protein